MQGRPRLRAGRRRGAGPGETGCLGSAGLRGAVGPSRGRDLALIGSGLHSWVPVPLLLPPHWLSCPQRPYRGQPLARRDRSL